jgi:hypothetical protein
MKWTAPSLSPPMRAAILILLAVVGIEFWLIVGGGIWGQTRQLWTGLFALVAAGAILLVRPARNRALSLIERVRHPSPLVRRTVALMITLAAGAYLYLTAKHQGRDLTPALFDEYSYLIGAKIIAAGHLWMPRHELAEFFDSFHILTDRAYTSKYPPGTAASMALALKLGLPAWSAPLACSALAAGVLYLVFTELIDGAAGVLGALMLVACRLFRRVSVAYLSQPLALLLILLAVWAYLKWRQKSSPARAAFIGASLGALAITRPMEAVCLGSLLLIAVAISGAPPLQGWGRDSEGQIAPPSLKRWATLLPYGAALVAAILPFLAIQLACNRGITGQWTTLPWIYYAHRDDPYDNLSSRPLDRNVRIASDLPQKRVIQKEQTFEAYQQKIELPFHRRFLERRLPDALFETIPFAPLIALIPIGLCALNDGRRWPPWAFLPLCVFAYTFYTFATSHYVVTLAPSAILMTLLGIHALAGAHRGWHNAIWLVATLFILAVSLTRLPEFQKTPAGDTILRPIEATRIDRQLTKVRPPCVVLFRFALGCDALAEPVYNIDGAWPDDAPIIRAHDKGDAANQRIFHYYAKRSPDRAIYLFDRAAAADENALHYLGTARELAK